MHRNCLLLGFVNQARVLSVSASPNMVSSSMEKISAALKSTDTKKDNLRKAFDSVKSHSSALATFTLQWSELEQHFDSLQKSLEQRFKELEAKEKQQFSSQGEQPGEPASSAVRSELQSFCLKMDGVGLRSFIMDRRKDLPANREDVTFALQSAPDPAKLVLDALQGFYPLKSRKDKSGGELGAIRRTCVLMLEGLAEIDPEIKPQVKENAKKLARDWKQKVSTESDDQLEALVFLQLLGRYGIASEFNSDELLDLLVSISRRKQAVDMFKGLGFKDKLPEFIQKLSNKGKQIDAVKFVYEFEMVDKFPPVPLLKAFLQESKKIAQEVRKKGNNSAQSQNEAIAKESAHLRAVIKCIEEHKLQSQYSPQSLEKRIEQLEKQKPEKKRTVTAAAPSSVSKSQQNHSQSGNKRPRFETDVTMHVGVPNSQINLQPTGLLREQVPPYLSSSAHYGLSGTNPNYSPYMTSSAGPPGAGGVSANQVSSLTHLYSDSQLQPAAYDRPTSYGGGYGLLPSYRSSFYS